MCFIHITDLYQLTLLDNQTLYRYLYYTTVSESENKYSWEIGTHIAQ